MVGSKLAMPILGQIWDLSDVDRDGFLDRYEFTVAMHLVFRALQGDKLPETLPEELSPEKVPKSLSAMPNLNGAQRVRTKIFFTFFRQINEAQTLNFGAKIQILITRKVPKSLSAMPNLNGAQWIRT